MTSSKARLHYGWTVAATTFLVMLMTAAAVSAPGVLLLPLQREFGWSNALVSTAMAIRLLLFGLMGPFAAAFMNRYGVRRVTVTALCLIATGLGLSIFMTELWQLMLLWGVVVGFGTGLTALVLATTVATRWFDRHRGLVVGFLTASSATGQLIFLPALAYVATHAGWRRALEIVCALLALAGLAAWRLLRDWPAQMGLQPVGAAFDTPLTAPPAAAGSIMRAALHSLREASRTRAFWILFATFFICGASTNGLIQAHFIPFCADQGLTEVAAASVLATMGIFDFFGTIASGWLSDRFNSARLLFWYYGLRGLSLIYLPYATFDYSGLSVFALFYGLDWIATVPPTVKLTVEHFGRAKANVTFGWIFAGHQLGAASAALYAGMSRSMLASYLPAFLASGALCIVAAILALRLRAPLPAPAA